MTEFFRDVAGNTCLLLSQATRTYCRLIIGKLTVDIPEVGAMGWVMVHRYPLSICVVLASQARRPERDEDVAQVAVYSSRLVICQPHVRSAHYGRMKFCGVPVTFVVRELWSHEKRPGADRTSNKMKCQNENSPS